MSEARLWRAEAAERLRAAMADGSHEARAAFGHWYRRRVAKSIRSRVVLRPFAFESEDRLRAALSTLERRWALRHERLCVKADLDSSLRAILARSVLRRVFDAAEATMSLGSPSEADLGVLG